MLLPRIVELQTDCASDATLLRACRSSDRCTDLQRFALQLTSTLPLRRYFPSLALIASGCLQCFDAVGWVAGRASGL